SVIAQSIMGILPRIARIESGEILFRDPRISADAPDSEIDLSRLDPRGPRMQRVRGDRLAIIFQEPMTALSPLHTIGDQVGETLALHRPGISRAERHAAVLEILRLVGFPNPVKAERTYPFELSGGLRQRAMIATALICRQALMRAVPRFNMAPGERLTPIREVLVTDEHLIATRTKGGEDLAPPPEGTLLQVQHLTKRFAVRKRAFTRKREEELVAVDDVSF